MKFHRHKCLVNEEPSVSITEIGCQYIPPARLYRSTIIQYRKPFWLTFTRTCQIVGYKTSGEGADNNTITASYLGHFN